MSLQPALLQYCSPVCLFISFQTQCSQYPAHLETSDPRQRVSCDGSSSNLPTCRLSPAVGFVQTPNSGHRIPRERRWAAAAPSQGKCILCICYLTNDHRPAMKRFVPQRTILWRNQVAFSLLATSLALLLCYISSTKSVDICRGVLFNPCSINWLWPAEGCCNPIPFCFVSQENHYFVLSRLTLTPHLVC